MREYANQLDCTVDNDEELYLNTKHIQKNKKPIWFGAVQIKQRYVSYHLMPVYVNPELLKGISPELKKRMQGRSCFNFTTVMSLRILQKQDLRIIRNGDTYELLPNKWSIKLETQAPY